MKLEELDSNEIKYFNAFKNKLKSEEYDLLVLKRLSSGIIEPYFNTYPIGKIKLKGRKYWMQIFRSLYKIDIFEGTLDEIIEKQDDVIRYLRKYCK